MGLLIFMGTMTLVSIFLMVSGAFLFEEYGPTWGSSTKGLVGGLLGLFIALILWQTLIWVYTDTQNIPHYYPIIGDITIDINDNENLIYSYETEEFGKEKFVINSNVFFQIDNQQETPQLNIVNQDYILFNKIILLEEEKRIIIIPHKDAISLGLNKD